MTIKDHTIAVVFPGQGCQRPGMGRDFHDAFAVSRRAYEEASEAVGWDVAALCFSDNGRIHRTEFTQPCILTTETAMFRAFRELTGLEPALFAGHSLGEFTALVAAGVLSLADAVRIVHERGRLMQEAVPEGGAMVAVIAGALDPEAVRLELGDLPVDVANVNSPRQIVLSGLAAGVEEAVGRLRDSLGGGEGCRFVPLTVSAPFHSRFMKPAEAPLEDALREARPRMEAQRAPRVASNVHGGFHEPCGDAVIRNLVRQVSGTVRWVENMQAVASGAHAIYEIGPGRPLRDFFRTLDVDCASVTTLSAARRLCGLAGNTSRLDVAAAS
jgi:[acyl-carrier-protein] S-malonyltransferase/trans-AT polyketide synthase/acyltransferase/oxidoreductase domain-containing protein